MKKQENKLISQDTSSAIIQSPNSSGLTRPTRESCSRGGDSRGIVVLVFRSHPFYLKRPESVRVVSPAAGMRPREAAKCFLCVKKVEVRNFRQGVSSHPHKKGEHGILLSIIVHPFLFLIYK